MHRWLRQGYAVHVFCNNDGERQRFEEIWKEYGLRAPASGPASPALSSTPGSAGARLSSREQRQSGGGDRCGDFWALQSAAPASVEIAPCAGLALALDIDFTDLEEGDYVVHLQHGIGRYLGLQVLPMGAGRGLKPRPEPGDSRPKRARNVWCIEYAPSDPTQPAPKLYVPVSEAHLVSKYVGAGKARPPLNTLGGTRWAKAKEHAERAVRDLAANCSRSRPRATRKPAILSSRTPPGSGNLKSSFLYEETPDQMRAIVETKGDMERPKPMDRLICGDVGFGKTEVAIRAAFKAVMDGKQVAVLVPTTVLAQQHFNTFRERMADYPIRVELLSRFRTRARAEASRRATGRRRGGHRDRHASAGAERHRVQGSWAGGHR